MAKQLGFILNQQNCVGCQGCQTACQAKNNSDVGISLRVADSCEYTPVGPFITEACYHCETPACIPACPVQAISKRDEDGIVVVDLELCDGNKECIAACPYDAPKFNENIGKMEKCDFCLDRLEADDIPACVESCPAKALNYGDMEILSGQGVLEGAKFKAEDTNPSVRFILASF